MIAHVAYELKKMGERSGMRDKDIERQTFKIRIERNIREIGLNIPWLKYWKGHK